LEMEIPATASRRGACLGLPGYPGDKSCHIESQTRPRDNPGSVAAGVHGPFSSFAPNSSFGRAAPRPPETNIVRYCGAYNASKGAKKLAEWFESEYCKRKNINEKTVSPVIRTWQRKSRSAGFNTPRRSQSVQFPNPNPLRNNSFCNPIPYP
jgi:hypothetical protein